MKLLEQWVNSVQNGLFGLDIGSSAVKLVNLRKDSSGWTAVCAAWSDIDPVVEGGDGSAYTRQLEAVRRCVRQSPAGSARYAVCGLSGPDAALRGFNFPPLPESAVEQAVRFEAQQVCPMDMRQSVLDYQLMQTVGGETPQHRSGVMVAGTEQAVGQRNRLVKEAGASLALLDTDGLAALNCLSELEPLERYETVALIDLGQTYTNVILLGPNGLPFVRDLNNGGKAILEHICQTSGLEASAVIEALWPSTQKALPDTILTAMHQAVRPLIQNISETLKYYSTQEKIPFAQKVYLCGGLALVRPLTELLSDALPTEVAVFDPFKTIHVEAATVGAELLRIRGTAFVTAAGLAMRTV